MDQATLTPLLDALRAESIPACFEGPPTPEQLHAGMLDVFRIEERLVDCVAVGIGFVQLGDVEAARPAFELAGRWFDVWDCFRQHGMKVPLSTLPGTPFYEAARFVLAHEPERHEDAVRWMAWAQSLSPRIDTFLEVYARLLVSVGRADEAVEKVARHRRRYPEDEALHAFASEFQDALDAVAFDDEAEVERRLVDRQIQKETRDYILGRAPSWPKGAWTYMPVCEALLDALIPDDHPMMRRLLSALGENDGRELGNFVEAYMHPLANLPEAVRQTLQFVEPAGYRGWELVRRVLPSSPGDHWFEGAWSYLDGFGAREDFVDRAWAAFEDQRTEYAALLRSVDPQWTERALGYLEGASATGSACRMPDWQAKELLQLLDPTHLVAGYVQLVTQWLLENVSPRAERIAKWLSGEGRDDAERLLHSLRVKDPQFPGDVRSWRMLPANDFFRRATRLSCTFNVDAIRVELERRGLPVWEVGQLWGYISTPGMIELLLGEFDREERFFGIDPEEDADLDWSEVPEEEEYRLPPIQRRLGRALVALVKASPTGAQRALTRIAKQPHGHGTELFLRGLALLASIAPDVHREWILAQKSPRAVRDWVLAWAATDPDALTWAHRRLDSKRATRPETDLALLLCARKRDETSLDAMTKAYRDRPPLRAELGEALAYLDPAFITRAAYEKRAAAHTGKRATLLRKGCALPELKWASGDVLDDAVVRYLVHLVAKGVGERHHASALVALLDPKDQAALAHALYEGAQKKAKQSYVPAFVLPFADARLAPALAEDVLDADEKVQHRDYLERIALAEDLLRALVALGAKKELEQLAPKIWNEGLRTILRAHVEMAGPDPAEVVPASGERPEDPAAEHWDACLGHRVGHKRMRSLLRRRGWRVGAIDREMIYESFYREDPRIEQGVELRFRFADDDEEILLGLTFYRLGTAYRPRDFPKGDYLATEFTEPPLKLGEVQPMFFHDAVSAVRAVMKTGSGFDPEWQNRY